MTTEVKKTLFCTSPLAYHNNIPIFSTDDAYTNNYKKIASDHIASIKPDQQNPFIEDDLWQQLERSTRELVIKYAKTGDRLLDVGVGLGRLLEPLTQFERHGIDISLDYLDMARHKGIDVAFSRIEDMPYADNTFDVVLACDVLEHVLDLHLCTREILRVLKHGGTLIVRVPFKEDLTPYLDPELPYEFVHLRNFDDAALRLHFCKIFGMKFLESAPIAPYLQGTPRLKIQLLREAERTNLLEAIPSCHWLFPQWAVLGHAIRFSAEKLTNWMYELRDKHPDDYQKVVDKLVLGIEINAVFKKINP